MWILRGSESRRRVVTAIAEARADGDATVRDAATAAAAELCPPAGALSEASAGSAVQAAADAVLRQFQASNLTSYYLRTHGCSAVSDIYVMKQAAHQHHSPQMLVCERFMH